MKFKIFGFENYINFYDDKINVLEIRNSHFFGEFTNSLNKKINGIETEESIILLDDNNEFMNFSECILLCDIFNLNLNNKLFLEKLNKLIEKHILNDNDAHQELEQKKQDILNFFYNIFDDLEVDLELVDDIDNLNLIKTLKLKFNNNLENNLILQLLNFLDLINKFDLCKVLITVNLKSYFSIKELEEIYKHCKYNNIFLLCLESNACEANLGYESKLIIDEDLIDFII